MQFIDLGKQYDIIGEKVREDLDKVLNHRKFINGPEVKELEAQLSRFVGVKHVICCGNGTDALTIPLMAWQLTKEDAVFVPSFTFFASAEAITVAGGTPVFVDCESGYIQHGSKLTYEKRLKNQEGRETDSQRDCQC
jgi:UDP-2-acetamido-2-deoxy-ribo-hexuluronate aminotransferase